MIKTADKKDVLLKAEGIRLMMKEHKVSVRLEILSSPCIQFFSAKRPPDALLIALFSREGVYSVSVEACRESREFRINVHMEEKESF